LKQHGVSGGKSPTVGFCGKFIAYLMFFTHNPLDTQDPPAANSTQIQVLSSQTVGLQAAFKDTRSSYVARPREHRNPQSNSMVPFKAGFNSTAVIQSFGLIHTVGNHAEKTSQL
jgi:hypothetical protein